ncbi:YadA-like family protein [Halomonas sp. wenzhen-202101]|uniref:YadA-like family protein n=1 Tax=Halomonas dongshanensis TaxID=2890835 RepID=A0ABT2EHI4_9GAMM|nr:YadA-like family protein [Halomonas dongshanensis]
MSGDSGTIEGLTNVDLDGADFANAGRAATEEQLSLVNDTANAGWNLTGEGADAVNIGPNGAVDFQGDQNISVAQHGVDQDGVIDITLERDLDLDSVTTGDTVLSNSGVAVGNDVTLGSTGLEIAGGPSMTTGGINAGGLVITNVAPGVDGTDAVNVDQLANLANTPITFGGDTGETERLLGERLDIVSTNGNLSTEVTDNETLEIALNDDLVLDSVTTGDSVLDTDGLTVDDGTGNRTQVGAGTIDIADANGTTTIGGNQITVGGNNPILVSGESGTIGGLTNTTFDPNNFTGGQAATEDQLSQVSTDLTAEGLNFVGDDGQMVHRDLGETLSITGGADLDELSEGNIGVIQDGEGGLLVELAKNIDLGEDGSLAIGGTTVHNNGLSIVDGPSVTVSGIDMANNRITSLAPGVDGSDAVNVDQLGEVSEVANRGWNVSANGENSQNVAPGDSVDFSDDGNVLVSNAVDANGNHTVNVALDSDLTDLDSIGLNGRDGQDGLTIVGGEGAPGVGGADGITRIIYTDEGGNEREVATMDDGLNFAGNTGDNIAKKLGETLTISGGLEGADDATGANLRVDSADGRLNIVMAQDLIDLNSITINDGPVINGDGINMADNRITNLAPGVDSADAVNVDQLGAVSEVANRGWNVSADGGDTENVAPGASVDFGNDDGNIVITRDGTDLTFDLAKNIDLGEDGSVTTGDSVLDTDGLTVDDGAGNRTQVGAGAINVADATGTTAISGNQMVVGGENPILVSGDSGTIGGLTNTTFDPDNYTPGQAATEDQLGQVYGVASMGWYVSANGEEEPTNVGPGNTVDFSSDGNVVIDREGTDLAFSLADSITLGEGDSAVTVDGENGSISTGDTVLNGGGVQVGDSVSLGDTGLVIADGPSVTIEGIHAGDRVITNVAPGEISETSTDAINGSQLWQVQDIANAGWNLSGSGENSVNIGPNGTVDFRGDANITVAQTGEDQGGVIEVALNDSITLGEGDNAITVNGENGSVTTGNTVLNGNGVQVGDNVSLDETGLVIAGGPSVTVGGINAGGMQISNVASGLGGRSIDQISGDDLRNAVNVGDLQQVAGDIGRDVAAARTEVEAGSNISVSQTTGEDGQTIYTVATEREVDFDRIDVGSVTIDQGNVDENGNTIIAGVGRGEISETSTDAVNGSQLWDVTQELGDIHTSLEGGMDFAADEGEAVNRRLGDTVAITGDENITTRTSGDGVQVTLNRDLDVDSVTAGNTTISDRGVTIADGPSMTVDGIDGGGMRITNVAPGIDANDAVNVGQMMELNQRFANEIVNVHGRISDVERNANAGTASALAASTVPQAWMPGKSMVGVGAGTYEGESAISVGVSRLSDNGRWVIQGKVTGDSQSNFGAGIGAGWHW